MRNKGPISESILNFIKKRRKELNFNGKKVMGSDGKLY
ncbi:hypothetical protein RU96_GL000735 [Enterococcus canintestini]|uniref:Uncharacterized protein n=1 Tax=Enterococcus canintestini TaxID=317010 RepID=A0A1L8R4N6_9ENTE|nr:hypothetical protein RU96_GL000735 [Enterococcus canintestini]